MRSRTWRPVRVSAVAAQAAAVLVVLAGCNNSDASGSYTAPPPASPSASPSASAAPSAAPTRPTGPPPVGRPMTAWEKQYRDQCQTGVSKNGCELYSDRSLRLQGINPDDD